MARYLVTGGAGFIGSNLVLALARAGERVRVVDDLSFGSWDNLEGVDVERITGDVRDPELMARASAGVEVVFHEAAIGSVPISIDDPVRADSVNVGGTVTVLDAARHAGVRRVILAASAAAYGDLPGLPKQESHADFAAVALRSEQDRRRAVHGCVRVALRHRDAEPALLQRFRAAPAPRRRLRRGHPQVRAGRRSAASH